MLSVILSIYSDFKELLRKPKNKYLCSQLKHSKSTTKYYRI